MRVCSKSGTFLSPREWITSDSCRRTRVSLHGLPLGLTLQTQHVRLIKRVKDLWQGLT